MNTPPRAAITAVEELVHRNPRQDTFDRDSRRNRQYTALQETAVDIDAEGDPEEVREQLREVRRQVAERRKAKG